MKTTDLNYASFLVTKGFTVKEITFIGRQGEFTFECNEDMPSIDDFFSENNEIYRFSVNVRMLKSRVKNGGQKEVTK